MVYVDSSVVLPEVVAGPQRLRGVVGSGQLVISDLLGVEVRRALQRLRIDGEFDDEGLVAALQRFARIERAFTRLTLSRAVLARASGPFGTPVKTLEAIHIATALSFTERASDGLVFVTADRQPARAAEVTGLATNLLEA